MNNQSYLEARAQREEEERKQFAEDRKNLREKLLADVILGEGSSLSFIGTFDGYGDSGQYNNDTGNDEVDKLLSKAIDFFVTFDWYNNDGGGGDLTWDVLADKIVINGYSNFTDTRTEMEDEEF